ncbi:MAG TPA: hypothetical protein VF843_10925, partial [Streptosporangiaceae bacterium]
MGQRRPLGPAASLDPRAPVGEDAAAGGRPGRNRGRGDLAGTGGTLGPDPGCGLLQRAGSPGGQPARRGMIGRDRVVQRP